MSAAAEGSGGRWTIEPRTALGALSGDAKLAGHAVCYVDGVFSVEGSGEVGQQFIRTHHARGQIAWSNPQVGAWAVTHFGEPGIAESQQPWLNRAVEQSRQPDVFAVRAYWTRQARRLCEER